MNAVSPYLTRPIREHAELVALCHAKARAMEVMIEIDPRADPVEWQIAWENFVEANTAIHRARAK